MRKILFLLLFIWVKAFPQITIDYPYNNQVLQRDKTNYADVSFLGKLPVNSSKVEYKLIPIVDGKDQNSEWKVLDSVAIGGFYQGKLSILGGLYKFQVRAFTNGIPTDSASLNRFGVGEVFIIAGQSNAQGVGRSAYDSGTTNEMVFTANFSSSAQPIGNETFDYIGFANTNYPLNKFENLKANSIIGPVGENNFFWPNLGNKIASNLKVPVCFFNVSWGGTSIRNWAESSRGIASKNPWIDSYYPVGFPFEHLKQIVKKFGGINGARAVLWHIGETDNIKEMATNDFVSYFKEVSAALTTHTGLNLPFLIAQSTYTRSFDGFNCGTLPDNSKIVNGLNELFLFDATKFLPGINGDLIEIPRLANSIEGCTHFSPISFDEIANGWYDKIKKLFSNGIKPNNSIALPLLKKFCSNSNSNILSTSNYEFDVISDGNQIIQRNNNYYENLIGKNIILRYSKNDKLDFQSPEISLKAFPVPQNPEIKSLGKTEFCNGNAVEISNILEENLFWNNGLFSKSITISKSEELFAYSKNQFDCRSENSNMIKVTVFENPKAPILAPNGSLNFCDGNQVVIASNNYFKTKWDNGYIGNSLVVTKTDTISAIAIDSNGCVSPKSNELNILVYENPKTPILLAKGPTNFCDGGQVEILSDSPDVTYWKNSTIIGESILVTQTDTIRAYSKNKYDCISPVSEPVTILVYPNPITPKLLVNGLDKFCDGKNVQIESDSPDSTIWNNGQLGKYIVVSKTDTLSAYAKNEFGCVSPISKSVKILVYPNPLKPILTAKSAVYFCDGDNVIIESNSPSSTIWNTGEIATSIKISKTNEIIAYAKNEFGCVSPNSEPLNIRSFENPAKPQITLNSPYVLYGGIKFFDIDYHWQYATTNLQSSETYLRVNQSGLYKLYSSKTYLPNLTCKSDIATFNFTLPNDSGLSAYPNPVLANEIIKIESVSNLANSNYILVDYLGRIVKEGKILTDETFNLPLKNLSAGKYIFSISTADQKTYSKQIVVQ